MRVVRRCRQKGNALLEFALSASILLPALLTTFQIGYSLYTYNKLESAVRFGARYAARRTYDSGTSTPSSAFLAAVQNMVVYANPNGGTTPVVPGLTTNQVSLAVSMYSGTPDMMTVSLSSFQIDAVVAKFTLTGKPWASYRFQGTFAPP